MKTRQSVSATPLIYVRIEFDASTELMRLGVVEAATTPPATYSDHRFSQHLSFLDRDSRNLVEVQPRGPSQASLQPMTSSTLRTSFMTSSSSRMSGLSDFPVPPTQGPSHLSQLGAYFDRQRNDEDFAPELPGSRRTTFGGEEDIAAALASQLSV